VISVLLVDDQALIRAGFRMVIDAEPDLRVVGEAVDGFDAVRQVRATNPDVVLMDVRMPGLDGVEATRRITASSSGTRVLILTTFDLDEYAFDGLRNGGSGFLLKDVMPEALCSAIRSVADGDAVLTPRITRQFVERFADQAPVPPRREPAALDRLTAREREVLDLLAAGLSNAGIARRLVVTEATVKTHVTRVLAKLELRDRVHAVIYAYEHDLRRPTS
jgi:DNA-binding NarL/FixJ family response regulator